MSLGVVMKNSPAAPKDRPYKFSGNPWAGKIPVTWKMQRVKSLLAERNERGHTSEPLLAATQRQGVVLKEKYDNRTVLPSNEVDQFKLVREGDFVISLRSFQGGIEYAYDQGIISAAYTVIHPYNTLNGDYFAILFKSRPFVQNLATCVTGIRQGQNIDYARLQIQTIPVPPAEEQAAIVRYLDEAEHQIQAYIGAKQKLIALLEEERQAVIHQAVTRGLSPNARLKPSGVDWLGDVPEHWDVMPLKRAFVSMDYGISDSGSQTGGVRLLTMGNIRDGSVTVPSTGGVTAVDQSLLLEKNDLLFNRTNSAELVAKVGLFSGHDSPVTFASYLVRMRSRSSNEPEYLNMALNETTFLAHARRDAVPSLHQSNLNPTRYGRIQISLPPKEEQKTILSALAEKTNGLTTSMELAHRQIELIEEYRTRLIADVVTGKLDVRKAAEELPQLEPSENSN